MPCSTRFATVIMALFLMRKTAGGGDNTADGSRALEACRLHNIDLRSPAGNMAGSEIDITLRNLSPWQLDVYWLNHTGNPNLIDTMSPGASNEHTSYPGHAFRLQRPAHLGQAALLVREFTVSPDTSVVDAEECTEEPGAESESEIEDILLLVHDQEAPCGPKDSAHWSCVRCLSEAELSSRSVGEFGFIEGEYEEGHVVGQTVDTDYTEHLPFVPPLTAGPGYLKMNMTSGLRQALVQWYRDQKQLSQEFQTEPAVSGGYSNNHIVKMDFLDILDVARFGPIKDVVMAETQRVLEWWTKKRLRHTSTYGARVYRRGAMFIDHVDRGSTHHASVVLQVAQTVDPSGGWPLEVIGPDGRVCEVYLMPGEMVLYEGARIRHGRPMRLRGDEFANVFVHFVPTEWSTIEMHMHKLEALHPGIQHTLRSSSKWLTDKLDKGVVGASKQKQEV